MPLQNREENETQDLGGVLDSADDTKVQFGRFVSLSNWVFGKLKSIKKKRGVSAFQGNASPAFQFQDNFVRTDCSSTFGTSIVSNCTITIANGIATVGNGCGFFVCPCAPTNFVQATYKNTRVGTPVSGIFLNVNSASTRTSFTGYGLIYDQSQATVKLAAYKWSAATLASVGTLLGSSNTTLSTNDVLRLARTPEGVFTVTVNGISKFTFTDTTIPYNNACIGLIGIGTDATSTQNWTSLSGGCPTLGSLLSDCCGDGLVNAENVVVTFDPINSNTVSSTYYNVNAVNITANCSSDVATPCGAVIAWPTTARFNMAGSFCSCLGDGGFNGNLVIPDSSIVGTPRLGIVLRVSAATACDNATMYGLIVDYTDDTIKIVRWNSQALDDYGTILASYARSLAQGTFGGITGTWLSAFQLISNPGVGCANGINPYGLLSTVGTPDALVVLTPVSEANEVACDPTMDLQIGFAAIGVSNNNAINSAVLQNMGVISNSFFNIGQSA